VLQTATTKYCAKEIKKKLVENNVCLSQNLPSESSITRTDGDDLGYSYKRLNIVARESLTDSCEEKLIDYLSACNALDPRCMHFLTNALLSKQRETDITVSQLLDHLR
ncbi:Hypothetical predicted protein, partial [Paramuricea clavata]